MAAYMVIEAVIDDRDKFMAYALEAAKLVEQFGGQYIVRGTEPIVLEGKPPPNRKVVISRWPDKKTALSFWRSPEYASIKQMRIGTARVRVTLFEGKNEF